MAHSAFIVTYVVAMRGSDVECGTVETQLRLRDARRILFATRTAHVDSSESIESTHPRLPVRWVCVHNSPEFLTGARESRTLHIPPHVSEASARRIQRLMGVRV